MPNLPFKKLLRAGGALLLLCAYIAVAYAVSRHQAYYDPYSLAGNDKISFQRAKIVSVNSEQIRRDEKHPELLVGSQDVTLRLLTGPRKDTSYQTVNNLNYDTNYYVRPGQTVIVSVSETGDGKTVNVNVNSPDRTPFLYLAAGVFVLLLCAVGGRSGFRSVLAIGFTVASTIFIFIPLLYIGVPSPAAALLFAAVTACVTLFLVGGFERKSLIAVLGTMGGVAAASGLEALFGRLTQTSGYTFSDTDSLLAISSHSGLKVSGLFFAAVLISSLGAVMDIAISVATAVNEIYETNPRADGKALFASGMNVGRDMLGTMANTLILAFTGPSLVVLIQIYTYNMPYFQVMNSNSIATEILQALIGSIAVILTAPLVSLLCAKLLPAFGAKGKDRRGGAGPELRP